MRELPAGRPAARPSGLVVLIQSLLRGRNPTSRKHCRASESGHKMTYDDRGREWSHEVLHGKQPLPIRL